MRDKDKHLCKLKDHIKEQFEQYRRLVTPARFVCLKCGRTANEERYLCKPVAIDK